MSDSNADGQCVSVSGESESMARDIESEPEFESSPGSSSRNTNMLFKLLEGEYQSDSKILSIIEDGCDVNAKYQEQTLLHFAMVRPTVDVAEKLIKKGADVNAYSVRAQTALHCAIRSRSLEAVAMCLWYGAKCFPGNPLQIAVLDNQLDIASLLIDCYNKDDAVLWLAQHIKSATAYQLLKELVRDRVSVNKFYGGDNSLLTASLSHEDCTLFKLIWKKLDKSVFFSPYPLIMIMFLTDCKFPTAEWLSCFYLMLEDHDVLELIKQLWGVQLLWAGETSVLIEDLFVTLLTAFQRKQVPQRDRVDLIYLFLSLNYRVHPETFEQVHQTYGYNEELDVLIHCAVCGPIHAATHSDQLMSSFILSVGDEPKPEEILSFYRNLTPWCTSREFRTKNNYNRYILKFFSLPWHLKNALLEFCYRIMNRATRALADYGDLSGVDESDRNGAASQHNIEVLKYYNEIKKLPTFPSLLELSRNEVRRIINQKCKVKRAYQLHYIVEQLNLHDVIKAIIRYKKPVY